MKPRTRIFLLTCAAAIQASRALADPIAGDPSEEEATEVHAPPFHFTDRPLTFDAVLGFGTPVGLIGGVIQYDVATALSVGAGAGTNVAGAQLAGLVRFRPLVLERPERALALQIGGAFAEGPYAGQLSDLADLAGEGGRTDSNGQRYSIDHVYWAQFDVGFEMKARSGFHLVTALGIAAPLNPGGGNCRRTDTGEPVGCDANLIESGSRPTLMSVATVMLGWAI